MDNSNTDRWLGVLLDGSAPDQTLRDLLDRLDGPCRDAAARLRRDSAGRTRMLSRLR